MARPKADRPTFKLRWRDKRWTVEWWADGRSHRVSCRTADQGEARKFLAAFEAGYGTAPAPDRPTIGAILDDYLADRKAQGVASPATLEFACAALKRHLGELEPDLLTKERSRFYAARRRAEGYFVGPEEARRKKPVSDGTIIRELVTLRAAFKWAVEARWITTKPTVEVPSQPPPRDRWLTREEARRLLASCREHHVRLFVALALTTAARRGAILGLRWEAVDLEAGRIDFGLGRGNKRRNRAAPIHEDMKPILAEARELAVSEWVIEYAGEPIRSVRTGLAAAAKRARVPGVTAHVMRHTAATWMAQKGVPLWEIAGLLQTSVETVERIYAKHSPSHLRNAVAAIGEIPRRTGEVTLRKRRQKM